MRLMRAALLPILPAVVGIVAVEALVRLGLIRSYLVPAPSTVAATIAGNAELWHAAADTAIAAGSGFVISALGGVILAILLTSANWVQRAFYPYAVFFQTVPIIAIAPLLVIWIGFGMATVIASVVIVSIFPVIANTLTGLLSTDAALRDLFKLYGAGKVATLMKLRLPFALPAILTGLRVAGGLAIVGAIVGEFITGAGIGGLILIARQQQKVDVVFACLLMAAAQGIAVFIIINLISRLMLRHWHASETGG